MMTPQNLAREITVKLSPFKKMATPANPWHEGHSTNINAYEVFFKIWDNYSLHSLLPVELLFLIHDTIIYAICMLGQEYTSRNSSGGHFSRK